MLHVRKCVVWAQGETVWLLQTEPQSFHFTYNPTEDHGGHGVTQTSCSCLHITAFRMWPLLLCLKSRQLCLPWPLC